MRRRRSSRDPVDPAFDAARRTAWALDNCYDWLWPQWLERQTRTTSTSYVAPGALGVVENTTGRNGLALGTMLSGPVATADPRGLVQLDDAAWSLDWWVGADDRWHLPSREVNVRQSRLGDGPVLETAMRIPGGDAVHRCWAVEDGGGAIVIEVENRSMAPMAVAFAVRPVGVLGVGRIDEARLEDRTIHVDGRPVAVLGKKPGLLARGGRSRDAVHDVVEGGAVGPSGESVTDPDGMAALSVVVPVPHQTSVRCVLLLDPDRADSLDVAALPTADQVVAGWDAHLAAGASIVLPDALLSAAFQAATARLFVAVGADGVARPFGSAEWDVAAEAAVLEALGRLGRREVQAVLAQRWHDRAPGVSDAPLTGVAARTATVLADYRVVEEYLQHVVVAADTGLGRDDSSRGDVERVLRQLGHDEAAAVVGRDATGEPNGAQANSDEAFPDEAVVVPGGLLDVVATARQLVSNLGADSIDGRLAWLVEAAGDIRSWPDYIHPRLGRGARGAVDSPLAAAAIVNVMVSLAVVDHGDGRLDLLPHVPTSWLGQPVDVEALATTAGLLSYAIRWHGDRPAVLWELRPHDGVAATITCSGLDASWSTDELTGEALLAAPVAAAEPPPPGASFS